MKALKHYNNDDLKAALADSKEIISDAEDLLLDKGFDANDQQLELFRRYKNLPQFDRDLLLLTTKYPIAKVAELYGVTSSYIYIRIKKIYKRLNECLYT